MKAYRIGIFIGLVIMQLLLITGCEKKEEVTMGRYIEQDMALDASDSYEVMPFIDSEGQQQIVVISEGDMQYFNLQDDSSFKEETPQWVELLKEKDEERHYMVHAITLDAQNQPYVLVTAERIVGAQPNDGFDNIRTFVLSFTSEGIKETMLQIEDVIPIVQTKNFIVLDNGTCVIGDTHSPIAAYDLETGELVRKYGGEDDIASLLLKDGKIYAASSRSKEIIVYQVESGQVEEKIACSFIDENTKIFEGEGGLYVINSQGIWHQVDKGALWEQIMEGSNVSLGLPSNKIEAAFYNNKSFVAILNKSYEKITAKAYSFSADIPSKPDTELTAYMLEENEIFRESLVSYELAHPEMCVNIRLGVSEQSGVSREDAIKALHTELLAGNGPDLLLLDGLDVEQYTDKGLLMPLNDITGVSDMVPTVRDAMKQGDDLYIVPLRFKIPCFMGISEVVDQINSIDDLIAYQAEHMEEPLLTNFGIEGLYNEMAKLTSKSWFNADGQLNQEALGHFLEGIKTLHDFYGSEEQSDTIYGDRMNSYFFDHVPLSLYDMEDYGDPGNAGGITETKPETRFKTITQEGKVCFEPMHLVAINKHSKEQKYAEELLSYMIQEDNQMQPIGKGLPTNQVALDKGLQKEAEGSGSFITYEGGKSFYVRGTSQLMYPQFKEMLTQLELPVMGETTLETMIYEEAKPYFNGEKELSEVLESLSTKVVLYQAG